MKACFTRRVLAASLLAAFACPPVFAGEQADLETLRQTTLNLINILVDQGVLSREKADSLVAEAEKKAAAQVAAKKKAEEGVVRVRYVPEAVKEQLREEIKQEVLAQAKTERWGDPGTLPGWLDRISWYGDIRLRAQHDGFASGNSSPAYLQAVYGLTGSGLSGDSTFLAGDTSEARDRLRLRARLGMNVKLADWIHGGVRLATGSSSPNEPVSTNQTLGTTSQKYAVWVDQAYLSLEPYEFLTASGGRIQNPWLGTDLVWHPDLTFEGVAARIAPRFGENHRGFLTVGAFPLQDIQPAAGNGADKKWLYGAQGGWEWTSFNGSNAKMGVALYDFQHTEGIPEPALGVFTYQYTAPQYRQKGNSVFQDPVDGLWKLSSKFRELNLTAAIDLAKFDPVHVKLTGDYVKNVGFDRAEILRRTGQDIEPRTTGYQLRLDVGYPTMQNRGDWAAFGGYKYLERDAVLDAFTDSDFHLGGTDAKGYFIGGSYAIEKNTWLTARWLSADAIDGAPGLPVKLGIDTFQLDLNAKF